MAPNTGSGTKPAKAVLILLLFLLASPFCTKAAAAPSIIPALQTPLLFTPTQSLSDCLEGVVGRASVLIPGRDPGYEKATLNLDPEIVAFPLAVAYPNTTEHVQGIVKCSRAAGVQAVPRSGGHSYEGYSVINGTVLVDLAGLDEFTPSRDNSSARVGTGTRLGPLSYKAWTQARRVFPAGICPYVGTGGHILGGGVGLLTRKYGLASDHLTAVEVVLYNGSVVIANDISHPDLFFACQGGGGGNFGIATTFTVNLTDLGNRGDVVLFQVNWGLDSYDLIPEFLRRIQRWAPGTPPDLSLQVVLHQGGFHVLGVFVGTASEFASVFRQSNLADLPGYSAPDISPFNGNLYVTLPYIEVALYLGQYSMGLKGTGNLTDLALGPETYYTYESLPDKAKSNILYDPISDAGLEVIAKYMKSSRYLSYFQYNSLGGAMTRFAPNQTAYPHRGGIFDLQFNAGWDLGNTTQKASQVKWLNDFYDALQPYVGTPRAYVNYIDDQLPDYLTQYFGDNLLRLKRVKAAYDPENYFCNPQSIPLPVANPHPAPLPVANPQSIPLPVGFCRATI